MRVVYMGTPDFAVAPLKALGETEDVEVVLVVTQPDKAVGRKQVLTPPPVKQLALEMGLDIYQPESLKGDLALSHLKSYAPDLIVVAAYGKILPETVLDLPRYGCINLHASLLPKYRGAAPIQWAIINREKTTGVTIQRMGKGIDTGDIISAREIEIAERETADSLFEKLSTLGTKLLLDTIPEIADGSATYTPQDEAQATYVAVIDKAAAELSFSMTAPELDARVRGFYSWPIAYTYLDGKTIKIYDAAVSTETTELFPGTVVKAEETLDIACGGGSVLSVLELQPEGKKRMRTRDFLNGHPVQKGERLGRA